MDREERIINSIIALEKEVKETQSSSIDPLVKQSVIMDLQDRIKSLNNQLGGL